ncbi:type III-B CRISPR module-associated Cmr3 family protein [Desulfococcus sp.]|uniref:type III-B CRISPR module-associated Cmr3 family protein n=1 Tax=Desulfococcus sp. TaxID=2025834 RepID=UPI003593A515
MEWYLFEPAGTLLFKGAEPMDMGADHHASQIFPPPARTIAGALRTAVLVQHGISYTDYYAKQNVPEEIMAAIGEAGENAPFDVAGPLFHMDGRLYTPAPYSWFIEKNSNRSANGEKRTVNIFKAEYVRSPLISADIPLPWVRGGRGELVSIGGNWMELNDLFSPAEEKGFYRPEFFFATEPRTGIALNQNRSVREGHLYTFVHIRMKNGCGLVFGTNKPLPLSENGFLKLGAEQRFGRYKKIPTPTIPDGKTGTYLSLAMVQGSVSANHACLTTGRIQYLGGWDLKKGFHKPMQGHFPAGSVFNQQIHTHCIQL